jgi:hypothetical protein
MSKEPEMTIVTVLHQRSYDDDGAFDFGSDSQDGSLDKVIESLIAVRDSVPPEYRASARCGFESDYESSSVEISVSYQRPATNDEIEARRSQADFAAKAREWDERSTYARLKAKYG